MRAGYSRSMPNERLAAVVISNVSQEDVVMRIVRSIHCVLLYFPKFSDANVRMDCIVTKFVSVNVLTGGTKNVVI